MSSAARRWMLPIARIRAMALGAIALGACPSCGMDDGDAQPQHVPQPHREIPEAWYFRPTDRRCAVPPSELEALSQNAYEGQLASDGQLLTDVRLLWGDGRGIEQEMGLTWPEQCPEPVSAVLCQSSSTRAVLFGVHSAAAEISVSCRPQIICAPDEVVRARASYERMTREAELGRRLVVEARQPGQDSNAGWLAAWEAGATTERVFVSESLDRVLADPLWALGLLTEADARTRVLGLEGESGETVRVRWRHELAVFLLDAGYCRLCGPRVGASVACRNAWLALYARESIARGGAQQHAGQSAPGG